MTPPSVLIVDVHPLVCHWLKQVITDEYRGVVFGEAASADAALARIAERPWQLVIIDISAPCRNGFFVVREVRRQQPASRILVLTTHADPSCAARALQIGASGYLYGGASRSDLIRALKNMRLGKKHFDRATLENPAAQTEAPHRALSAREFGVLLAVAAGKSDGQIAAGLVLSVKTITTYKRRILDKLRLKSTADMTCYVLHYGLSRTRPRCLPPGLQENVDPCSGLRETVDP